MEAVYAFLYKALPLILMLIMLALGMSLTLKDFKVVATQPRAFFVGAVNQMVLVPLVALLLIFIFKPSPGFAFGMMLISFCPGSVTSNMLTYYSKGNTALSIALTAVVGMVSVITMPLLIAAAYQHFLGGSASNNFDVKEIAVQLFVLIVVPVLIGMLIRRFLPKFSQIWQPRVQNIASLVFVVLVFVAIVNDWEKQVTNMSSMGVEITVMIVVLLSLGMLTAKLARLNAVDAKTIAIESGIQNAVTALTLAPVITGVTTRLPPEAVPAAAYSVLMYIIAIPFIFMVRNRE